MFKSGSMHREMASKTYKFKRQMNAELSELKDESAFNTLYFESIQNWWKVAFELHIDDGTNDL